VVKVLKVLVTSKQIEEEFTMISPQVGDGLQVADNTFTVRFPNSQLIEEWSYFNPIV
jgi:hypothetical protein